MIYTNIMGKKSTLKTQKNHNNVKERFANAIRQHRTLTGINFVRLACKKYLSSYNDYPQKPLIF